MMADMGETELTPMVAVDPFHLPQSEPLALTVNNKEKESSDLNEFRQEQEEEEEEEVNFKQSESEKKTGFTFTVADDTGENQPFTLQVPLALSLSRSLSHHSLSLCHHSIISNIISSDFAWSTLTKSCLLWRASG